MEARMIAGVAVVLAGAAVYALRPSGDSFVLALFLAIAGCAITVT